MCLSILDEEKDWRPAISVREVLLGIQRLLVEPNVKGPAQAPAWEAFTKDRAEYERRVREQARAMAAV